MNMIIFSFRSERRKKGKKRASSFPGSPSSCFEQVRENPGNEEGEREEAVMTEREREEAVSRSRESPTRELFPR